MDPFLKRLYRERRRAVLIAILTFLGGFIAFYGNPARFYGLPFSVFAGLAFMVGLTPCLGVIFLVFPKIRHSTESVALSIPGLALMGVFSEPPAFGGLPPSVNVLGLMMCLLFVTVYGSTAIDRFLPRRTASFRSTATSTLPPEILWPYLDLSPDSQPRHISDDLVAMDWITPGTTYREISRSGDVAQIEAIVTLDPQAAPFTRRSSYTVPNAKPDTPGATGTRSQTLTANGAGSRLQTTRQVSNQTLRSIAFLWIDDAFGRNDDEDMLMAQACERALKAA